MNILSRQEGAAALLKLILSPAITNQGGNKIGKLKKPQVSRWSNEVIGKNNYDSPENRIIIIIQKVLQLSTLSHNPVLGRTIYLT